MPLLLVVLLLCLCLATLSDPPALVWWWQDYGSWSLVTLAVVVIACWYWQKSQ